jgi:23S rRNA pseudouridine1911/1915/1917 synthase
MTVREDGRLARTDAYVIARLGTVDLLRLELHSGRTHQIRVHLESIGHPVVGDAVYGGGGFRRISGEGRREAQRLEQLAPRQALHAAMLAFRHPISGEPIRVSAAWPEDLWPLLQAALGAETPLGKRPEDREGALVALGFRDRDG